MQLAPNLNVKGKKVEKLLEGFAAKVFQHEYDHLQGIENIYREDAIVMDFTTKEEMLTFMQQVKKEDSLRYNKPNYATAKKLNKRNEYKYFTI